ncbi:MAG TPA: cytochrome c [Duganella sp.]|nr:cytochrome c [Duganella sp.]
MRDTLLKAAMVIVAGFAAAATAPSRAQTEAPDGKALFLKNCAACHQATGKGIPGAFPALAGSKFVTGERAEVATVLLKGRGGMPDFSENISDADMAAILTYVRSSWGNKADALTESEVLKLRDTLGVAHFGSAEMSNKH